VKLSPRIGTALILLFSVGSTLADSMFRLMSMMYDGFFTCLIIMVVLAMGKQKNEEGEK
jgi:hypothetical protein